MKKLLSLVGATMLLAALQRGDGAAVFCACGRGAYFAPLHGLRCGGAHAATAAFRYRPGGAVGQHAVLHCGALDQRQPGSRVCGGLPPHPCFDRQLSPALPAHVLAYQGQVLARVRQIAPTVFLNYKFGEPTSRWRPSVGLGINYTNFDKRTSTAAGNALNGGPTHISMSDSWGLAAQVGLSYRIDERWSIQGALMTARVKSRLTATTAGVPRTMDIRFRPAVFTLTAGYAF